MSLDISWNPIVALPFDLLTNATNIKLLDISKMNLRRLPDAFIPPRRNLNVIKLAHNPWRCDCDLFYVIGLSG